MQRLAGIVGLQIRKMQRLDRNVIWPSRRPGMEFSGNFHPRSGQPLIGSKYADRQLSLQLSIIPSLCAAGIHATLLLVHAILRHQQHKHTPSMLIAPLALDRFACVLLRCRSASAKLASLHDDRSTDAFPCDAQLFAALRIKSTSRVPRSPRCGSASQRRG